MKAEAEKRQPKAIPEDIAMGEVLRSLAHSPNLPLPFLEIAKGFLVLDSPGISTAEPQHSQHQQREPQPQAQAQAQAQAQPCPVSTAVAAVTAPPKGRRASIIAREGRTRWGGAIGVTGAAGADAAAGSGQSKATVPSATAVAAAAAVAVEEMLQEAARKRELASDLKSWASRRGHAARNAKDMLATLRESCAKADHDRRKAVLFHLRSVDNPSKICRNLGTVVEALIHELEVAEVGIENNNSSHIATAATSPATSASKTLNTTTIHKKDSKNNALCAEEERSANTTTIAAPAEAAAAAEADPGRDNDHPRHHNKVVSLPHAQPPAPPGDKGRCRVSGASAFPLATRAGLCKDFDGGGGRFLCNHSREGGDEVDGKDPPVAFDGGAEAFIPRRCSIAGASTRGGRRPGGVGRGGDVNQPVARPLDHRQVGVGNSSSGGNRIQDRCEDVKKTLDSISDDQLNSFPNRAEGKAIKTSDARTTGLLEEVQKILVRMKGLPHAERNLEAEEAILGAVAIILVWQPPPAWERSRTRFDAHIIAAARTLMDKAFLPTEPSWHWPQKHYPKRLPRSGAREGGDASVQRLSVFGNSSVKVSVFRRAKERGRGGAAGSEGGARLRRKRGAVKRVWFIPACIFRYASKPAIPGCIKPP